MKSNEEWKLWGKVDPLFGVASWQGKDRGGSDPWTDEEFYRLGEDWYLFASAWKKIVGYDPGAILEIGCGAGRITNMLSKDFARVIATDVSSDMLEYARARVSAPNITWQLSDGDRLPVPDASADAVFSCHVFQHFPDNKAQLTTFREIFRVLRDGATFFIHLPIHSFPGVSSRFQSILRSQYSALLAASNVRAWFRRFAMRLGFKPYMHTVSYEMSRLLFDLAEIGFSDLSITVIVLPNGGSIHPCVCGRKLIASRQG